MSTVNKAVRRYWPIVSDDEIEDGKNIEEANLNLNQLLTSFKDSLSDK